jgi:hypothetical protein
VKELDTNGVHAEKFLALSVHWAANGLALRKKCAFDEDDLLFIDEKDDTQGPSKDRKELLRHYPPYESRKHIRTS